MLTWREFPFLRLLLSLMAGILLSYFSNFNHAALLALLLVWPLLLWAAARARGLYRHRWLFGGLMYLLVFQLGYQTGQRHDERNWDKYFGGKLPPAGALIIGTVRHAPVQKGKWVRLRLAVGQAGPSADSLTEQTGNLLLYVARDTAAAEAVQYGDRVLFHGQISEVEAPGNPHSFDYRRYLHFQNLHHQAFARAGDWQVLDSGNGNPVFAAAIGLQSRFLATLEKHLHTRGELAVGSALILGHRDDMPDEVRTAYSQTGAMHVLAVSGLHVGIVFLLLHFFVRWVKLNLWWWRFAKVLFVLAGIWGFALVTGASPSVMRAAVMFSCVQLGLALQRDAKVYNTLAISAFGLLLWNPFLLASVSFQLSYLAVVGIVFFQPRIARLVFVRRRWLDYLWQLGCVSLAAQLMLVPLTFFYFHQFPTYFWLTSMLLVPLAGFELGTGLLLLLLENIWPSAAILAGKVLWLMLKLGNLFVGFVQGLPAAVFDGIYIGVGITALLYLILASVMFAISSRKFRYLMLALAFLLLASIHFAFTGWQQATTQQLVVYDIYKHTAIDVFAGENVLSITSPDIDEKSLGFATEGHRFAMGAKSQRHISLGGAARQSFGGIYFEKNFLHFQGLRLAVVDGPIYFEVPEKIKLDYVLLSGSPKVFIEELQHVFEFEKIICDSSNKKWQVEKWRAKCEELGVGFYDVAAEGAFVLQVGK